MVKDTKPEFLDSKPHTEEKKETRKEKHYYKEKRRLSFNLFSNKPTTFKRLPSHPSTRETSQHEFQSDTPKKETISMPSLSLPRRTREKFSLGRQSPSRKHPNKRLLQGGPPHPKTLSLLTSTPLSSKAFARSFVQCRPDDEG
jgi:hypothetical protein